MLIKAIRERGVRERLIERIEEVLRETKSRVRIGEVRNFGRGEESDRDAH